MNQNLSLSSSSVSLSPLSSCATLSLHEELRLKIDASGIDDLALFGRITVTTGFEMVQ